jgi:hypothetical protein
MCVSSHVGSPINKQLGSFGRDQAGVTEMWCPVDAVIAEDQPAIEWMDLHGIDFREPFFNETLARIESEKRGRVLTTFDALLQFEKICDGLSPSGFILHSSRCGSTLVANACRAVKDSIVICRSTGGSIN